jgi:hypothetical protein
MKSFKAEDQIKALRVVLDIEQRTSGMAYLKQALDEIKTLGGIIPICSHCKKFRDDQGYWNQLEKFIAEHSDAQFSHSICDKCLEEHYPEYRKTGTTDGSCV